MYNENQLYFDKKLRISLSIHVVRSQLYLDNISFQSQGDHNKPLSLVLVLLEMKISFIGFKYTNMVEPKDPTKDLPKTFPIDHDVAIRELLKNYKGLQGNHHH